MFKKDFRSVNVCIQYSQYWNSILRSPEVCYNTGKIYGKWQPGVLLQVARHFIELLVMKLIILKEKTNWCRAQNRRLVAAWEARLVVVAVVTVEQRNCMQYFCCESNSTAVGCHDDLGWLRMCDKRQRYCMAMPQPWRWSSASARLREGVQP